MFTHNAETAPSKAKSIAVKVSFAAGLSLLAACGTEGNVVTPAPTPETTVQPTTPTTESVEQTIATYLNSNDRLNRIQVSLNEFGRVVIDASQTGSSTWGAFDAYCSSPTNEGDINSWTSTGYQPAPGDICSVQHNPRYGDSQDQVIARVSVGMDGSYADIQGAMVTTDTCSVMIEAGDQFTPPLMAFNLGDHELNPSTQVISLEAAQSIDDQILACLDITRPE